MSDLDEFDTILNIYLTRSMRAYIDEIAVEQGVTPEQIIRDAIDEKFDRPDDEPVPARLN